MRNWQPWLRLFQRSTMPRWPVRSPCRTAKPCARRPWGSLSRPIPPWARRRWSLYRSRGAAVWCRARWWIGWCACALGSRRRAGQISTPPFARCVRRPRRRYLSNGGNPRRSGFAVRWWGGAQSLFALAKQGRRFALACLLVKSEVGVQDAWVRDGMTKVEADDLIAQIVAGAEAVEISIGLLGQT